MITTSSTTRFVVVGPPAAGKTTLVESRRRPGDWVWDSDQVLSAITGLPPVALPSDTAPLSRALRQAFVSSLMARPHAPAYVILTSMIEANHVAIDLHAEVVVVDTDEATCVARIEADPARAHKRDIQIEVVRKWWSERRVMERFKNRT